MATLLNAEAKSKIKIQDIKQHGFPQVEHKVTLHLQVLKQKSIPH